MYLCVCVLSSVLRASLHSVASTKVSSERDEAVQHAFLLEYQDEGIECSLAQRDALSAPIRPLRELSQAKEVVAGQQRGDDVVVETQEQESYEDLDAAEFRLESQGDHPYIHHHHHHVCVQ